MTRGALVGLAAIVAMVAEPWWRRWLDYRPAPPTPPVDRSVLRGELRRPGRDLERRPGRDLERRP